MKHRRRHILTGICAGLIMLSAAGLGACSVQRRPEATNPPLSSATPTTPSDASNPAGSPQVTGAQDLEEKITQLNEVDQARVVLMDQKAWVGVRLKDRVNGNLTDTVKTEIADLVKKEDSSIQTVYVTADANIVDRLETIRNDLAGGKPISGFSDELTEFGRRITPSTQS
jgi:YhcN/YlaJ family sporulation lipoprotein